MAQFFRQGLKYSSALLAGCLIILFVSTATYAAPAAIPDLAKLDDFDSISNQVSEEHLSPARTVMQIIDNQFYKWQEYENPVSDTFAIYLLEPEEAALCSDKAFELLQMSGQWINDRNADLSTGAEIPTYSSNSISETANVRPDSNGTVLYQFTYQQDGMTDDRIAVNIEDAESYPYNTIGFLTTDFPYEFMRGTGFLISPHTALTNAHNIYSPQFGGWYRTIRFTPAQYEDNNMDIITPHSTINPDQVIISSTFKEHEDKGDREKAINHDYGAIFFETPVNSVNTFMPLEFNHLPEKVSLLGYPGNVRGKLTLGMWLSEGPLIKSDQYCLYYEAYTSGGNSGSPVFVYNERADTYRVVAIHSFASANYFSGGPHLNDKNRSIIEEWLRWAPEKKEDSSSADRKEQKQNEEEIRVPELSLNKTDLSLIVNDSKTLTVKVNSDDISFDELIWISKNPRIANVEENGTVTGVREGKTVVKVTTPDGRVEAGCEITVIGTTSGRLPGDVNGDNLVDVQDVVMITRHVLNYAQLDDSQQQIADVNNNSTIDVQDVTLIIQFALGLIDTF